MMCINTASLASPYRVGWLWRLPQWTPALLNLPTLLLQVKCSSKSMLNFSVSQSIPNKISGLYSKMGKATVFNCSSQNPARILQIHMPQMNQNSMNAAWWTHHTGRCSLWCNGYLVCAVPSSSLAAYLILFPYLYLQWPICLPILTHVSCGKQSGPTLFQNMTPPPPQRNSFLGRNWMNILLMWLHSWKGFILVTKALVVPARSFVAPWFYCSTTVKTLLTTEFHPSGLSLPSFQNW